jgi:hypothetical protein
MVRAKLIAFHLLVPPMLAELLTGNVPPSRFFHPLLFLVFVLLYGCGALLIREFRVRWNLRWSILFLGIAYAVVEEGLTTKAFFNPRWQGAGLLSGYGMYWGVQWVWLLGVTFSHATLSTLVPITMADGLWPECRHTAVLGRRGVLLSMTAVLLVCVLGMLAVGTAEGDRTVPFHPQPWLLVAAALCVVLCCWLAYRFRNSEVETSAVPLMHPGVFFILGFLTLPFFLIVPNAMVTNGASGLSAALVELAFITLVMLFVFFQLSHRAIRRRHTTALVVGFLMPLILLTPLHEFHESFTPGKNGTGMVVVGSVALVALCLWRRAAMAREVRGREP